MAMWAEFGFWLHEELEVVHWVSEVSIIPYFKLICTHWPFKVSLCWRPWQDTTDWLKQKLFSSDLEAGRSEWQYLAFWWELFLAYMKGAGALFFLLTKVLIPLGPYLCDFTQPGSLIQDPHICIHTIEFVVPTRGTIKSAAVWASLGQEPLNGRAPSRMQMTFPVFIQYKLG